METILAIDLGKYKSVFCKLDTTSLRCEYFTVRVRPQEFHDLCGEFFLFVFFVDCCLKIC